MRNRLNGTVLTEIGQGFIVQEPRGGSFVVQCWKHWYVPHVPPTRVLIISGRQEDQEQSEIVQRDL